MVNKRLRVCKIIKNAKAAGRTRIALDMKILIGNGWEKYSNLIVAERKIADEGDTMKCSSCMNSSKECVFDKNGEEMRI